MTSTKTSRIEALFSLYRLLDRGRQLLKIVREIGLCEDLFHEVLRIEEALPVLVD
jgi:hypothetical protein